jgi:stage IV sporulation protein FB
MADSRAWSVNLGSWGGVQVRLHALFFLVAVFALYISSHGTDDRELLWYGLATLVILFGSVLLHESAHCLAAIRMGGRAKEIVIGPLGGLAQISLPADPRSQWVTALAGPLANLLLCVMIFPVLFVLRESHLWGLLNPLIPESVIEGPWRVVLLKLAFWVNWVLVLVNLLPALPFDGGKALRAVLRPVWGVPSTAVAMTRIAWCTAIGLCVLAWFVRDIQSTTLIPAWMPLALLAILLFFSTNQETQRREISDIEEEYLEYELTSGFSPFEPDEEPPRVEDKGLLGRWLEKRREEKDRLLRAQEEQEEDRVDEILIRIHGVGMNGLSPEERALLQRVSARYRNRQKL